MATIRIYIENVNTRIAEGWDSIKLYRGLDPAILDNTSTLIDTVPLVEDQENYEIEDGSGTSSYWYGYTLYDPDTPAESSISLKWRALDTDLLRLMMETAKRCNAGFSGECSAQGSLTTLIDESLDEIANGSDWAHGWWVFWHSALFAADRVPKRVADEGGYASGGQLSIERAWTLGSPQEGDAYQVYGLLPPLDRPGVTWSWQRAVNEGLSYCRWTDQVNVGDGDGRNPEFSLKAHLGYINPERDIRNVHVRRAVDEANGVFAEIDWSTNGRWWERGRTNEDGEAVIRLYPPPPADCTVWVELRRDGSALYALTDTTTCPEEMVVEAAAWRALEYLASNGKGDYAAQAAIHQKAFLAQRRKHGAPGLVTKP